MATKKEVVEETTSEPKTKETKTNVTKAKMTKPVKEEQTVTKVDLSKPIEPKQDEVKESDAEDSGVVASTEGTEPTQEQEVQPEAQTQEASVLEEITDEQVEEVEEQVEEAIAEAEATGEPLPENIQMLVDFMQDTGGDINDYVKLNQNYDDFDSNDILREYYNQTKPHLNNEEINFLMEDQFSFDEEEDDDRDIRRKKLALKEQVASAKAYLDGQKSKYYEEIKAGSKLTGEQQKAVDFFNRYNVDHEENEKQADRMQSSFINQTNDVFDNNFKGFDYSVGEKKFRYNVKDANQVKANQSDLNNFIGKFLGENAEMKDAAGYHKSLFTAMNPDAIANHFYEQGKADALKTSVTDAKNVDMSPRQAHVDPKNMGGYKAKVLGNNSSDFKFKIKNNKFKN